ncbi:hypothetical protein CpipJ_CPIJ007388 [Culex quinquefasciatus]|uniref:Uncharacterized protein n=1 Tax=Culex quinquefasciatus TaxID=7176 RepID=B0WJF2_CULQU|nr:hypothetical protein CpipJ_CPIJ007388 [Culex quinquefasciatus]|eukprot:XP_001848836.1 hypothetical protein CpipJ_CPIJ007388 [Culex quinquefasciatus]
MDLTGTQWTPTSSQSSDPTPNLNASGSPIAPILTVSLVRTSRQHGPDRHTVDPNLKPVQ